LRIAWRRLAVARAELEAARIEVGTTQGELKKLEPRLSFSPKLPTSVLLSIVGQLVGKKPPPQAVCVEFWGVFQQSGAIRVQVE